MEKTVDVEKSQQQEILADISSESMEAENLQNTEILTKPDESKEAESGQNSTKST